LFDVHQHRDRGADPVGQLGHFTSTEIATEPINGSKGKEIPELTTQSGFRGNGYLIVFD
jgi:hypothetical protein